MQNTVNKKRYHYFYKITNIINGKFYYGVHSTFNLNDGYDGSGKIIHLAYKKYGKENFEKEILKFFDTSKEMYEYEAKIVNKDLVKDSNCYNIIVGGLGIKGDDIEVVVIDKEGKTYKVSVEDPRYLSGEFKHLYVGKTVVKDENGNVFAVDVDKVPKNCHGIQFGKVTVKNKEGKTFSVDKNDSRYLNGELESVNKGKITVIDKEGNYKSISKEEFYSENNNEYISMFKGSKIYENDKGEHKRLKFDDPRVLSGEFKPIGLGTSAFKDIDGNVYKCSINDPRVLSGELVGISKGKKLSEEQKEKIKKSFREKMFVNKDGEEKFIEKELLNKYLNDGWKKGRIYRPMSEQSLQKMKEKISKENKGRIYINKDGKEKIVKKEEIDNYLLNGWKKGQCIKRNLKVSLGTKWINNGIENKYVKEEKLQEYLDSGWNIGMLKRNKKS